MDVNIRKTATDTAYIVVGVGVLGFQQAQVRRRDAMKRVTTIRHDARSTVKQGAGTIKSATGGCAGNLGSTIGSTVSGVGSTVSGVGSTVTSTVAGVGSTLGSSVGSTVSGVGSTVGSTVTDLGSSVGSTVTGVVTNTVDAVGSQVKAGADVARTVDPRAWVDPVVGDLRVRVEPVIEQVRTINLPGTVSAIPEQVSKVIDVGRAKVQGRTGTKPTAVPPAAANGDA